MVFKSRQTSANSRLELKHPRSFDKVTFGGKILGFQAHPKQFPLLSGGLFLPVIWICDEHLIWLLNIQIAVELFIHISSRLTTISRVSSHFMIILYICVDYTSSSSWNQKWICAEFSSPALWILKFWDPDVMVFPPALIFWGYVYSVLDCPPRLSWRFFVVLFLRSMHWINCAGGWNIFRHICRSLDELNNTLII